MVWGKVLEANLRICYPALGHEKRVCLTTTLAEIEKPNLSLLISVARVFKTNEQQGRDYPATNMWASSMWLTSTNWPANDCVVTSGSSQYLDTCLRKRQICPTLSHCGRHYWLDNAEPFLSLCLPCPKEVRKSLNTGLFPSSFWMYHHVTQSRAGNFWESFSLLRKTTGEIFPTATPCPLLTLVLFRAIVVISWQWDKNARI